jgi:hypothetical protein
MTDMGRRQSVSQAQTKLFLSERGVACLEEIDRPVVLDAVEKEGTFGREVGQAGGIAVVRGR